MKRRKKVSGRLDDIFCVFLVPQLCPTLCDPMDGSPPASSVHGLIQARILEWVAKTSSRRSSQPRIEPRSPASQPDSLLLSHQWSLDDILGWLKILCRFFYKMLWKTCTNFFYANSINLKMWRSPSRHQYSPLLYEDMRKVSLIGVEHKMGKFWLRNSMKNKVGNRILWSMQGQKE